MGDESQEFIDSLKVGDLVAVRNRRLDAFGKDLGYVIYKVMYITPKRTRFDIWAEGWNTRTADKRGFITGTYSRMMPVTDEIRASIDVDTQRIKASRRVDVVLKSSKLFDEHQEEPSFVAEFLDATEPIKNLMEKWAKKT